MLRKRKIELRLVMDNLETVQILLKIADTLDNKSLFKEASSITNIINRVVVSELGDGDSPSQRTPKKNKTKPLGLGSGDTPEVKNKTNNLETTQTKPTEGQEKQYQIAIQRLKNELFSGARTPKEINDFVNASNSDTNGFYHNFVSKGALTEKQFDSFKLQIKSILNRFTDTSATKKPETTQFERIIDDSIQRILNGYMTKNKLTIRDLADIQKNDTAKKELTDFINNIDKDSVKKHKKEFLDQLNRTLKSYKQASNNKLIKEAQQINRYNSEDINVQELRNGNLEETHNLGSIMPGENLTSNQAQSLVSRIYKRDKDFIESTFTFQLRHNDDNTLDIIVNIQD
jgi:hypothetical protein